jgi:hypothetical protein
MCDFSYKFTKLWNCSNVENSFNLVTLIPTIAMKRGLTMHTQRILPNFIYFQVPHRRQDPQKQKLFFRNDCCLILIADVTAESKSISEKHTRRQRLCTRSWKGRGRGVAEKGVAVGRGREWDDICVSAQKQGDQILAFFRRFGDSFLLTNLWKLRK